MRAYNRWNARFFRVTYDLVAPHEDQETEICIWYSYKVKEMDFPSINQQFQLRLFLAHPGRDHQE